MPKLYEYLGLTVFFYANEHEPIHVHGRYQGKESKAEIILEEGVIREIIFGEVAGKRPLEGPKLRDFQALVAARGPQIVEKWVDCFIHNRRIRAEVISREL
jgi:hypothetical protein